MIMPGNDDNLDKAILILNLDNLDDLEIISSPIITVAKRIRSRLLVILLHPLFATGFGTSTWNVIQRLLTHAYIQATAVSHELNNILMNIEVILRPPRESLKDIPVDSWNALFHSDDKLRLLFPETISTIPSFCIMEKSGATENIEMDPVAKSSTLPVVALGGTFDHLHSGHKILLSMAAWIAEKKVIIGITDDNLLVKKSNRNLIESLDERMKAVSEFLTLFRPGIEYNLVPIVDVYGPTASDPDIQALVVSKETLSGASSKIRVNSFWGLPVASLRSHQSFPPLKIFVIDVISAFSSELDADDMELLRKAKLSSTYIRQWILKQRGEDGGPEDFQ